MALTNQEYDLLLGNPSIGVMLDRAERGDARLPAQIEGGFGPAEADDQLVSDDVPVMHDDFSGGAFYSKRLLKTGYAYAEGAYCRDPRVVLPAGAVTELPLPAGTVEISGSFEQDGHLYLLAGALAVRLGSGTDLPVNAQYLGAGFVADGAAAFNGATYVGGSGGNLWRLQGGVWTQSASAARRKAATVSWVIPSEGSGISAERLIMATSDLRNIRYVAGDPLIDANWGPVIRVGSSSHPITSLVSAPRHAYICKTDGLYDLNSRGETPHLTPGLRHAAIAPSNGAVSLYWGGFVYFTHVSGLYRVWVGDPVVQYQPGWCQPGWGLPNETPIHGACTALAIDQGWIIASVYNGTNSYQGAGVDRREVGIEGIGPLLWHFAEVALPGERITHMRVTAPGSQPRLWIATMYGGQARLRWVSLPKAATPLEDFLASGQHRFQQRWTLYPSVHDWGDADAEKIIKQLGVVTENLGTGVTMDVAANADGGAWTSQGTIRTSPRARLVPRAPLSKGQQIGLRIIGNGTALIPAVLRSAKVRAEVNVELFERRRYPIRVQRGQKTRNGATDRRNPARVWQQIVDFQRAGPIDMVDEQGNQLTIRVRGGMPFKQVEDKESGDWTYIAALDVTVLDIVAMGGVGRTFKWNDGTKWNSSAVWKASGATTFFVWNAGWKWNSGIMWRGAAT